MMASFFTVLLTTCATFTLISRRTTAPLRSHGHIYQRFTAIVMRIFARSTILQHHCSCQWVELHPTDHTLRATQMLIYLLNSISIIILVVVSFQDSSNDRRLIFQKLLLSSPSLRHNEFFYTELGLRSVLKKHHWLTLRPISIEKVSLNQVTEPDYRSAIHFCNFASVFFAFTTAEHVSTLDQRLRQSVLHRESRFLLILIPIPIILIILGLGWMLDY